MKLRLTVVHHKPVDNFHLILYYSIWKLITIRIEWGYMILDYSNEEFDYIVKDFVWKFTQDWCWYFIITQFSHKSLFKSTQSLWNLNWHKKYSEYLRRIEKIFK